MRKLILPFILALFISATAFGQTMVNITFELNVATLGSNVSAAGMYIGGGSGFGGPTDNVMTDQGGGIWSITFQKPVGFESHYTFLNGDGGWGAKEQIGGLPCADPTNFNDRYLPFVTQDTTVKACFGTCDSDGSCTIVTDSVDITFMLNTSNITVDATGMFLAGGGTFGNPGDNAMSDMDGDGVYEFTTRQPKGFVSYYTFTNGNSGWGAKEDISGLPCAQPANFNDRLLPAVYSDTTLITCFATCSSDTSCFSAPPPAKVNPDLPITFEDTAGVDYNLVDFGNINTPSMVVVDPTNPNNLVVQTTKSAGSAIWAGTTLGDAGLVNPIPFTATNQKMYVDVWSPTANTPILLKVEDVNDGQNIFAQVEVNTTMANAWETLEFDFANPSSGSIDLNNTYGKVIIFYNFGTIGADETYYCDNVAYGNPVSTKGLEVDANLFTIQPSLVKDFVNITFGENAINKEKQLMVVNAIGQVIENRTINNDQVYTLDATRYANGLYFLSIRTENAILTQKFVVNK